jgi:hypothetical protein
MTVLFGGRPYASKAVLDNWQRSRLDVRNRYNQFLQRQDSRRLVADSLVEVGLFRAVRITRVVTDRDTQTVKYARNGSSVVRKTRRVY